MEIVIYFEYIGYVTYQWLTFAIFTLKFAADIKKRQIQLVLFSQSENSLPDLRAAAIIRNHRFWKQHKLYLCEAKRYFMIVNDCLSLIKWCSVKLYAVLFLYMCSLSYKPSDWWTKLQFQNSRHFLGHPYLYQYISTI